MWDLGLGFEIVIRVSLSTHSAVWRGGRGHCQSDSGVGTAPGHRVPARTAPVSPRAPVTPGPLLPLAGNTLQTRARPCFISCLIGDQSGGFIPKISRRAAEPGACSGACAGAGAGLAGARLLLLPPRELLQIQIQPVPTPSTDIYRYRCFCSSRVQAGGFQIFFFHFFFSLSSFSSLLCSSKWC